MYRLFLLLILISFSKIPIWGQAVNYQNFNNIVLSTDASTINCFSQDNQGIIWMGTNKGLFSYDGYSPQSHFIYNDRSNTQIHCILIYDGTYMYLGTDNGILRFNYKTDRYEPIDLGGSLTDVRAMVKQGNTLWIGSLNGLYKYDIPAKRLIEIPTGSKTGLPHKTIYSLITSRDNTLYVGTYNGFCKLDSGSALFEKINLPADRRRSNQFINSLYEDQKQDHIWIGTEGALYKYNPQSEKVFDINQFHDNSIKSLSMDNDGLLLLATDNGLYTYDQQHDRIQHLVHDSRNSKSLSNNIIWSIFADRTGNIWLGTDYGISLAYHNRNYQTVSISQLTGIGEGNRFHSIYKDSRGNFWFGGTNGLIFKPELKEGVTASAIWYRMGDSQYPISHNRIRDIYEDKDHNLWIATDGSISRFDYSKRQFVNYSIVDSTQAFNSNWAYYIFEDDKKQLWVATCLGGIFVVDKEKLLSSQGNYIAEKHYSVQNGLSGNFVNQILSDHYGNVWVLLHNNGINKIDARSGVVSKIHLGDKDDKVVPNYLIKDSEGSIWIGYRGGLTNIDPKTNNTHSIKFDIYGNNEILSMTEVYNNIWVSTTDGIWAVDKKSYSLQKLDIANKAFTCSFFDKETNKIYMGGVDEYTILSPEILNKKVNDNPIVLTAIYVNDKLYNAADNHNGNNIRYINEIYLDYTQNNILFDFSDLSFAEGSISSFVYKLDGVEDKWNIIKQNTNRISYTNLEYGRYTLLISKLDAYGKPSENMFRFLINITPPWYYTVWAKSVYILLVLGFIMWIINFFRVRNNLRIERIEKEKTVELTNLKMDFFTNVSHEFKTPLSLIIAPVSKLLHETKDSHKKKELEVIQKNALKINSLIRQIIDFNRSESTSSGQILSRVEIVEFARSLFSVYEDGYRDKGLSFLFSSNKERIYMDVDVLKIEAVLNNLLTNACKYTDEGVINLSLIYNEESGFVDLEVRDTGIGIPENEVRYVFERFYQSSKTAGDKEGTGIGLYLVKLYTEQHHGYIKIQSVENKGTSVTVGLPVSDYSAADIEQRSVISDDLPYVLIVEDNNEIANFICQTLSDGFRCEIAHNGKQGLDMCLRTNPALVIADIMMPIMDGMEMVRHIRKNVPTSTIPIILLTAKDDKRTELDSIELAVDAFMPKPFDPQMLRSKVEQLLNTSKRMESKIRMETIAAPQIMEVTSPDEKFLSAITQIVEDRIADPDLNVSALSSLSGVGSKQIYRKIKLLTGLSPVEYIRSIRIKKAAILLSQNKFTISEVMYMVGFSNHSYFSKCFQSEFGKTPRQFLSENN